MAVFLGHRREVNIRVLDDAPEPGLFARYPSIARNVFEPPSTMRGPARLCSRP